MYAKNSLQLKMECLQIHKNLQELLLKILIKMKFYLFINNTKRCYSKMFRRVKLEFIEKFKNILVL